MKLLFHCPSILNQKPIRRLSNQYILTAQKLSALYFSASFSESLSHLMNLESTNVFFSVFFMVLSSCTAYVLRMFSSYDMSINSALSQKWHREQHIRIFAKWLIQQFRDQYLSISLLISNDII